jgi:HK97 family phage prohead protease
MTKIESWSGTSGFVDDGEVKAIREEETCFRLTGYAATWDSDRIKDIIVPGAFKKSLEQRAADGDDVQLYYNHRTDDVPIGNIVKIGEDKKGLRYEAELSKEDDFVVKRIAPAIKSRALKANSFGFRTLQSSPRQGGGRVLKELELIEISVVNTPCNRLATIVGMKNLVEFQDLPVDVKSVWDNAAALARVRAHFGEKHDELKSAFLFVDEAKTAEEWDSRLLIADIVEGRLVANRIALYKANAALCGARGGITLPDEAGDEVKSHIDRYFSRMGEEYVSPIKSLSADEFDALTPGEREARLAAVGISQKLAKKFIAGHRDGDRAAQRDVGPKDAHNALLSALLLEAAAAINRKPPPANGK